MKNIFSKLLKLIDEPRNQKIIFIALPCVALAAALLIVTPQASAFFRGRDNSDLSASAAVTQFPVASVNTEAVTKAAKATPLPTASPAPVQAVLTGSSTERDLLIRVKDSDGAVISNEVFKLTLYYPDGEVCTFDSEDNGSCYVVDLAAGEYTVKMEAQDGYLTAESISCQVKAAVEYAQIEDVDDYLDIVDSSDVSYDEVKTGTSDAPQAAVAEAISSSEAVTETTQPVVDSNGNQMYTYSFQTDAQGYLLYSSGETSPVKLFDEDGDGVPECGMITDEYGNTSAVYLYNSDNTPDAQYAITATPVVSVQSSETRSGWEETGGNVYYYNSGSAVTGLKEIDGKIYFFNEYGVRARSVGIDVSFYNEYINWAAVKANGVDFAIIRVGGRYWSREDVYNDERTAEYLSGAKAAGIKVGVYFYSTATSAKEAVQEASFALEKVAGYSLDYPIFIDMEYSGIYPDGRSDKLTRAERAEVANAFCQTVINSGYAAGVYTGQNFLLNAMDANSISQYPLWLANYTNSFRRPSYTGSYSMWQFTDMGQVKGISGYVDMNVIF